MRTLLAAVTLSGLLLTGCASKTTLTQAQIDQQYPLVSQASAALSDAERQQLARFAPEHIKQARMAFEEAKKQAVRDDSEARANAKKALDYVAAAEKQAAEARYVFEEILNARDRAMKANANSLASNRFQAAEERLQKMFAQFEVGEKERAKRDINELKNTYLALELEALKTDMLSVAEKWLARAKSEDLDDKTPILYRQARDEYQLALNTLEADRTNTQRANVHSNLAIALVKRAQYVAEIEQYFDNADFTEEQKIIWYQDQLAEALSPLMGDMAFDQPNKDIIDTARNRIQAEMQQVADLRSMTSNLNSELQAEQQAASARQEAMQRAREEELLMAQLELEREQQAKREATELFEGVQSLFDESEATVYRQRDNVLIRAHGFAFPTGSSEIESSNFALLNKIIDAISRFPESTIKVSGHTDATGSDELNQTLSERRAETVAGFLNKVGKIDEQRITHDGFGEDKPVASNDTVEGRAQNRRVEILIVN